MTLLALENVSKAYGRGSDRRPVLCDVSLQLDGGELLAIWGIRHSGRSTLLRIAAGLERPDSGDVRLEGESLVGHGADAVSSRIGYCRRSFGPGDTGTVLDRIVESQLVRGALHEEVSIRARRALLRVGAEQCASLRPSQLDGTETMRVAIARAIASEPRLLVVDDPTLGVDPLRRDEILLLLRSLADEGIAVLTNTDRATGLAGADRALALGDGELRGEVHPTLAPVVQLRRPA